MRSVCSCTQRIWLCTTDNNIELLSNKTTSKSQDFNSTLTLSKSPIIIHGLLLKDFYSTCPAYAPQNMPRVAWSDYSELRGYKDIKKTKATGAINSTLPDQVVRDLRRAYYR